MVDIMNTRMIEKSLERISAERHTVVLIAPKQREMMYFLHKFQVQVAKLREKGDIPQQQVMTVVVQRTEDCEGTQKLDASAIQSLREMLDNFMSGCLVVANIKVVFTTQPFVMDRDRLEVTRGEFINP